MFAPNKFQQFQQNSNDQEIINLQNNLASFEKRLDELQKCRSGSDVAVKIEFLQTDLNNLQRQVDDAAKSGRQEVKDLSEKFNQLKALTTESIKTLSQRINSVDDNLQANTNRDNIHACFLHLDGGRSKAAAAVADQMTTDAVEQIIKDYCSPENKHKEGRTQVLSEFIIYMKDSIRRDLYKSLLISLTPIQHMQDERQFFVGGTLLCQKQHQLKLNEFYGNHNQEWELVYKAVKHGFGAAAFHGHCDGQAPTMIVIQSQGGNYLFGAFTKLLWSHNRGFKQDTTAFLFTLTNPHSLPPTKFNINKSKSDNAVYHPGAGYLGEPYDFYLFGFGGDGLNFLNFIDATDGIMGYRRGDLFIASDCNTNSYSSTRFPCSYSDTHGFGDKTFTGTATFTVSDIEVYILK